MITDAQAGVPFLAEASGATPDLLGTITVGIYTADGISIVVAPTTTGITEPTPGSYAAMLTVETPGTYLIRWVTPTATAEEALIVSTVSAIRPTVPEVAALVRTRTSGPGGNEASSFTTTTRPTIIEADALIDQALEAILTQLPTVIGTRFYAQTRHMVSLYAAILIEGSYFREQLDAGAVELYMRLLEMGMASLRAAVEDPEGSQAVTGYTSVRIVSPTNTALEVWPPEPVI